LAIIARIVPAFTLRSSRRGASGAAPRAESGPAPPPAPDWPFHRVYLWDAPTRVAPLLIAAAVAGAWLTADRPSWLPLHRALDTALPMLALFHLLWPLGGARGLAGWRGPRARWAPRTLGPGPLGLMLRLVVAVLALVPGMTSADASAWHTGVGQVLAGLVALQALANLWVHRRAGDACWEGWMCGTGRGRLDEALPRRARGVALVLLLMVPALWALEEAKASGKAPAALSHD